MKIKILDSFSLKLVKQVKYIAEDKPKAARKFKKDMITQIKQLSNMPYKNKKSIYFDDENIRDLVFKGYTVVYRVKPSAQLIEVFGFVKYKEKL